MDVDGGADVAHEAAALVAGDPAVHDPAVLAGVAHQAVLVLPDLESGERLVPGGEHLLHVVRVDAERPARAELLGERRARETHPALVHERHEPARVRRPDHHWGAVGEIAEAGLRLAQRLLHGAPLVDVGRRPDVAREDTVGEARHSHLEHPAVGPGGSVHEAVLEAQLLAAPESVAPARQQLGAVVGVCAEAEGVAELLAEGAAREAQPALVDERHVCVGVGHPHERGRRVRELAEARLAVAHAALVVAALGSQPDRARERADEVDVLGLVRARLARVDAEHAEVAARDPDRRHEGARHAQLALDGRGHEIGLLAEVADRQRLVAVERDARELLGVRPQHPSEHVVREAGGGANVQAAPVARQLEDGRVVRAELAAGRLDGGPEDLVEIIARERAPADLRHGRLPARQRAQLVTLAVARAPQHRSQASLALTRRRRAGHPAVAT